MTVTPESLAKSGTEEAEQTAFFAWCALMANKGQPELSKIFAIPNGGKRDKITAGKLKAAGVKAGVWDVFFPEIQQGTCGLWIEFKVGYNKLTPEQEKFRDSLGCDFKWMVCYSWREAAEAVIAYLGDEWNLTKSV